MKFVLASLVFVSSLACVSSHPKRAVSSSCPVVAIGERNEDCPWAGLSREMQDAPDAIDAILAANPIHLSIEKDVAHKDWLSLWGVSSNFDESARGEIVPRAILKALNEKFGTASEGNIATAKPEEKTTAHAGVAHTYGYLFSNLQTKYGFKRARWVLPTLDEGFKLPRPTLAPLPADGTLFSNVTYFAGMIALDGDEKRALLDGKNRAAIALQNYDYGALNIIKLVETSRVSKDRTVELRTHLVKFKEAVTGDPNSFLLIYSVKDRGHTKLISAFPVDRRTAEGACDAKHLGENKPISTRYNAIVDGITGTKVFGSRKTTGCNLLN